MREDEMNVSWDGNMRFTTEVNGHKLIIDANEATGGNNTGPRPKPLMLTALGGCTGIDVISILHKMRVIPSKFNVKMESDVTEEHPKHYSRIKLIYEFEGENLAIDRLKRAVELSEDRYCGVSYIYKKSIKMEKEIRLNGEIV